MSKTQVGLSADAITAKWNKRMKASVPDIQAGIDTVTESPAEKAIAKKDKMLQNITASINDGTWERGLQKVTLSDWKEKTKKKVAERLSGGVDGAIAKHKAFSSYLVNALNTVLPEINKMPDMTLEDSVQRVRRLMEHMSNNKYKAQG